jgi:hypothetical protein
MAQSNVRGRLATRLAVDMQQAGIKRGWEQH